MTRWSFVPNIADGKWRPPFFASIVSVALVAAVARPASAECFPSDAWDQLACPKTAPDMSQECQSSIDKARPALLPRLRDTCSQPSCSVVDQEISNRLRKTPKKPSSNAVAPPPRYAELRRPPNPRDELVRLQRELDRLNEALRSQGTTISDLHNRLNDVARERDEFQKRAEHAEEEQGKLRVALDDMKKEVDRAKRSPKSVPEGTGSSHQRKDAGAEPSNRQRDGGARVCAPRDGGRGARESEHRSEKKNGRSDEKTLIGLGFIANGLVLLGLGSSLMVRSNEPTAGHVTGFFVDLVGLVDVAGGGYLVWMQ